MIDGMSAERVSVTMDSEVASQARTLAGPGRFSAWVNEAVRLRLQSERLGRLLAEMDDEAGPVPEDLQREVDELWRRASSLMQER